MTVSSATWKLLQCTLKVFVPQVVDERIEHGCNYKNRIREVAVLRLDLGDCPKK